MGKHLGEKVDPKPTKEPPEWQPTSRPGIFKSRITGHFQTWFDQDGKPLPGTPNPSPIAEDPSAFSLFFPSGRGASARPQHPHHSSAR